MLYTRKGDGGQTGLFGCNQKISKSSAVAEALGSLDEINSLLGLVKSKSAAPEKEILNSIQQNLFIIQAELAGAPKTITEDKVKAVEKIVDDIEKILPPIKSFFVPGGGAREGDELSAMFDYARTVSRRAERRAWLAEAEAKAAGGEKSILGEFSFSYLNRLSSLLYALARLMNHKSGINEEVPSYN